jgi:hypothetical protein
MPQLLLWLEPPIVLRSCQAICGRDGSISRLVRLRKFSALSLAAILQKLKTIRSVRGYRGETSVTIIEEKRIVTAFQFTPSFIVYG